MKELEILFYKYINDLKASSTGVDRIKCPRYLKASKMDAEYALSSHSEKIDMLYEFQNEMEEFKMVGYNVDKYLM